MVHSFNKNGSSSLLDDQSLKQDIVHSNGLGASIRRSWPWTVPLGVLLASLAAFLTVQLATPRYRSSSLLEANRDYIVFKDVLPTIQNLAKNDQALIFNSLVIDPILANPSLRSAPSLFVPESAEENLRKNLTVESDNVESRMIVSYEDTDPTAAAVVCNAIVAAYLRQRDAFDHQFSSNRQRWLLPEIQRWRQRVEQQQRIVSQINNTLGQRSLHPDRALLQYENQLSLVSFLHKQITEVEVQLAIANAQDQLAKDRSKPSEKPESNQQTTQVHPSDQQEKLALQAKLKVLKNKHQQERLQLELLDLASPELLFAQRELQISMDVFDKLNARVAAIRTEQRQDGAVRVLAIATAPNSPIEFNSYPKASVAASLGFILPFFGNWLLGFRIRRQS